MGSRGRVTLAVLLAGGLCLAAPGPSRADAGETAYGALVGTGSALTTLVYAPLKLAYAVGGTVVGGLAWLFSFGNGDVAGPVVRAAVGGDYVVTPSHLEGRRPLHFVGPDA